MALSYFSQSRFKHDEDSRNKHIPSRNEDLEALGITWTRLPLPELSTASGKLGRTL